MIGILPDLLRSLVTNVMLVMLLFTLGRPRFGRMIRCFTLTAIVLIDLTVNCYFYLQRDYTSLAKFDILYFVLIGLLIKPLFYDGVMQWLFNCITVWNVYSVVIILSYYLSDLLPFPYYANTILRAVLLGSAILLFRKKLQPLYRQATEQWNIYLIVAVGIFLNFIWAFISGGNIEQSLQSNMVSFLLLVGLSLMVYTTVFRSLKENREEEQLREENLRISADRKLTRQRLSMMDDAVKKLSVARHDQRHFNHTLAALLEQGQTSKAAELLERQLQSLPQKPRVYCENISLNAAVSYYAEMAERLGISCDIRLIIPAEVHVDDLSLAMAVSNLMENAINACCVLPEKERRLSFSAVDTGQLLLEISNPCHVKVRFDDQGLPVSDREGHGQGVRSVAAFVKHCSGYLEYKNENDVFCVRMII